MGHTFASESVHDLFLDTLLTLGEAFILLKIGEIVSGLMGTEGTDLSYCHVGELIWV
jgi:hypothetical protein